MPTTAYVFSDTDRVDLRRYCDHGAYGTGVVVFPEPWVFRDWLAFETRLNNLTPTEAVVIQQYLTQLRTLETAIPGAGDNLGTDQAAVWYHNRNEVRDRMSLYRVWRQELCTSAAFRLAPT
jgi:hypothetical protein